MQPVSVLWWDEAPDLLSAVPSAEGGVGLSAHITASFLLWTRVGQDEKMGVSSPSCIHCTWWALSPPPHRLPPAPVQATPPGVSATLRRPPLLLMVWIAREFALMSAGGYSFCSAQSRWMVFSDQEKNLLICRWWGRPIVKFMIFTLKLCAYVCVHTYST